MPLKAKEYSVKHFFLLCKDRKGFALNDIIYSRRGSDCGSHRKLANDIAMSFVEISLKQVNKHMLTAILLLTALTVAFCGKI